MACATAFTSMPCDDAVVCEPITGMLLVWHDNGTVTVVAPAGSGDALIPTTNAATSATDTRIEQCFRVMRVPRSLCNRFLFHRNSGLSAVAASATASRGADRDL